MELGFRQPPIDDSKIDIDLGVSQKESEQFVDEWPSGMAYVDAEFGVSHEHIFQEQGIAETHAILREATVSGSGRAESNVNTDRNIELFRQSPVWLQFR